MRPSLKPLDPSTLQRFGSGLKRPECVAVTAAGEVFVSHAPSDGPVGIAKLAPDGAVSLIEAKGGPADLLPNGWSMDPDGGFLLANLGDSGGVWRLGSDGTCAPILTTIEGRPMPPVNFVHRAEDGALWISISTWRVPRDRALHRDVADGCVIRMASAAQPESARIVADGLGYANEVKIDPTGRWLYAHETMARRLSRYALDGESLGPRETVVDYIDGIIPDGFEFDSQGGLWCASVMSNRLLHVAPDGTQTVMLDDSDADEIDVGMAHWRSGKFSRADLNIGARRPFGNIASVTFGGPDLKTLYLGSLFGEALLVAPSPVAGAEPPYWRFPARS
jgi:sugar lactone lactonase YvrE